MCVYYRILCHSVKWRIIKINLVALYSVALYVRVRSFLKANHWEKLHNRTVTAFGCTEHAKASRHASSLVAVIRTKHTWAQPVKPDMSRASQWKFVTQRVDVVVRLTSCIDGSSWQYLRVSSEKDVNEVEEKAHLVYHFTMIHKGCYHISYLNYLYLGFHLKKNIFCRNLDDIMSKGKLYNMFNENQAMHLPKTKGCNDQKLVNIFLTHFHLALNKLY